jgi:sterol desaturase/sphingolipid hydroxylase (fatty acid hydroxylase superfamily)
MSAWLILYETGFRVGLFVGLAVVLILVERLRPRRVLAEIKWQRWFDNFGLGFINIVVTRVTIPVTLVALAINPPLNGWGLLNGTAFPPYIEVLIAFLFLDLVIYWQHRLSHTSRWFWQLHQVHHSDRDFDVSTAVRFHPLEILLSLVIKAFAVLIIGAPVVSIILFELVLSSAALFNHSNINLPAKLDWISRWIIVTPDMHRVHHSCLVDERNSNFGFNLPWWDRLFSTYKAQPTMGHKDMTIGLNTGNSRMQEKLLWLLRMPFVSLAKPQN